MNRTAFTVGSLLVCLLITFSTLSGMTLDSNDYSPPDELSDIDHEIKYIGGTDPTSIRTIDSDGIVGEHTSIAIDSNGYTHISYYDSNNGNLKYSTDKSGAWVTIILDTGDDGSGASFGASTGDVGEYTSIAIDSNDKVHITYYAKTWYESGNANSMDLKYANDKTGVWLTFSIYTSGNVGKHNSIHINSFDDIAVSFYDDLAGNLKFVRISSWGIVYDDLVVNSFGNVGEYSSLTFSDSSCRGYNSYHISYYDRTNSALKESFIYDQTGSGNWVIDFPSTIDGFISNVGKYSDIAIDSNCNLHVSYYDETNDQLKYAIDYSFTPPSSWSRSIIDDGGGFSSIAIDSNDLPHIAYYDVVDADLKYANLDDGYSWNTNIVDSAGVVGRYSDIALNSNDAVHISYLDNSNTNLKLAFEIDTDLDGILDKNDECPYNYGNSTEDRLGCIDTDGDGWSDLGDDFHNKPTQWRDSDGDGLGDNWEDMTWFRESHWPGEIIADAYRPDANPFDFDNDGFEDEDISEALEGSAGFDDCPTLYGTSIEDVVGCIDSDGDGWSNDGDDFPGTSSQWIDNDSDGYGDNEYGMFPDSCPDDFGTSYVDVFGCIDNDNDGFSELNDVDDDDSSEWDDSDGDGYGDNGADQFPYDDTQYIDSDGDGYGDNITGNNPDAFPNNPDEWEDSDGDGYGDEFADEFPYDSTQFEDNDGDGYGDNISGNDPDLFPNNSSEWADTDGDGHGDEEHDAFPYDNTQWSDIDDDGYGDNLSGNNPDKFPFNPNEWEDSDGDGFGDNGEDFCPYVNGTVAFGPYPGCPDSDGDGWADLEDEFDNDPTQFMDMDSDGYGDNMSGNFPDSCPNQPGTSTKSIFYGGGGGPGPSSMSGIGTGMAGTNVTTYGCPDSDSDGYEDINDPCPFSYGNSWVDTFACPDSDQDGISDYVDPYPQNATDNIHDWDGDGFVDFSNNPQNITDKFPSDRTQWNDTDGDGYGDNLTGNEPDLFPNDDTQWADSDGDGYGDNEFGFNSDGCIYSAGNSTEDRFGCPDNDGDGYSNPDSDWSILYGADAFISEPSQWHDYDGDGYGDNMTGINPDACWDEFGESTMRVTFNLSSQSWQNVTEFGCPDEDGDGYDDDSDPCPFVFGNSWVDELGCLDTDQDGISDINDPYPLNATTNIYDWDGDGYIDHSPNSIDNIDLFDYDRTQWFDADGDGMGDNPNGDMADLFPNDYTQWSDTDGDGYGDNALGLNPDHCRFTSGTSLYPILGCTDQDGDSWADSFDDFQNDDTQWEDFDGDGYGDNSTGNFPDACPNQAGNSVVRAILNNTNISHYGCEDNDNDGYDDASDPCPNQYGTSWVDRLACLDSDEDGISDSNDPAPGIPTINPEDWDGDGYLDHSPDTLLNVDMFPNEPTQWDDTDGDGYGDNPQGVAFDMFTNDDSQWSDEDGDGYGDNPLGFNADTCVFVNGNSTIDRLGCLDSDGDGHSDSSSNWLAHPFGIADSHPYDSTQWQDLDSDGCGDNQTGNNGDQFPTISTQCADSDGDGYGDNPLGLLADEFPEDENEWSDQDGDGYGDNSDQFPLDETQWIDSDGDSYGDNGDGRDGDEFPNDPNQWMDSDGDGYGDDRFIEGGDKFPDDPYQWNDTDGDGYGDEPVGINADAFPDDSQQWSDRDGDGYGDNSVIDGGDKFPDNPTQWMDTDEDGYGDNSDGIQGDAFPNDPQQWKDTDSDQCGDNIGLGIEGGDYFPKDPTQCADSDEDGYGDNEAGNSPDAFPNDSSQWEDSDGDGLGDNEFGNQADLCKRDNETELRLCVDDFDNDGWNNSVDLFPEEPTQWIDDDNDGKGDNCEGRNGDCSLNDRDNDGYTDPLDPVYDEQGFIDSSKLNKGEDAFPDDPTEWSDFDQDNIGDNADQDDDGDGVPDTVEIREGTDAFNSADKPFEGVNILGLTLGEWDLITIFIGGPSAIYLLFALLSRNKRTEKYEQMIYGAKTEEELEEISNKYELSLQMRLIGPHHGLRLERIRSKQENILEYDMVEQHNSQIEDKVGFVAISEEEE